MLFRSGEQTADMGMSGMGGAPAPGGMGGAPGGMGAPAPGGDEFAATDAAAGGEADLGREMR